MSIQTLSGQEIRSLKPPIAGKKFDVIFCLSVLWLLGGTFADAWAHNNIPRLETFWTPWHAILYSGLFFLIGCMFLVLLINRGRTDSWRQAIPYGYQLSYFTLVLMVLVGLGDMTWHLIFGVEQVLDALFSPTHLTGALGIAMLASGPLYSLYLRRFKPSSFTDYFLLATAILLPYVLLVNVFQPFSIFSQTWPTTTPLSFGIGQLAGISGMLLHAALFTFFVLYASREWTFKPGMFTYILGITALGLSVMNQYWFLIPVFLIAGLLIDLAYRYLKPSSDRLLHLRLFSAIAAATPYAVYNIWLPITTHVVWTAHMLSGSVYLIGMLGWALSYLVYPPRRPSPTSTDHEEK